MRTIGLIFLVLLSSSRISSARSDKQIFMTIPEAYPQQAFVDSVERAIVQLGYESVRYVLKTAGGVNIHDQSDTLHERILSLMRPGQDPSIVLVSFGEGSFPVLLECARNKNIVSLVTIGGCFINGDDYLYEQYSRQRNLSQALGSYDGKGKEKFLGNVYEILQRIKDGRKIPGRFLRSEGLKEIRNLMSEPYHVSILRFDIETALRDIRIPTISIFVVGDDSMNELTHVDNEHRLFNSFQFYDYATFRLNAFTSDTETIRNFVEEYLIMGVEP